MASSLRNLMSSLSIQVKNLAVKTPKSLVYLQSSQFSVFNNGRLLLNGDLQPVCKALPLKQNIEPQNAFHTTPVTSVTYELKQWREHRIIHRFYRLHWGAWIRCFGGRFKGLYKKSDQIRWKLKQNIFCTKSQCRKLDTLVTAKWRKPLYYVDSPYEPYHVRTNCPSFPNHRKFYP